MKKTVLIFGVISGLISAVTMIATIPFMHKIDPAKGMIIGYTTMVLAGLLVFFGIRSYRENVSGGKLTFARGFAVGLLITLLSNCFYVGTWEVINYKFMPRLRREVCRTNGRTRQGLRRQSAEDRGNDAPSRTIRAKLPQPRLQHRDDFPGSLPGFLVNHAVLGRDPAKKIRARVSVTLQSLKACTAGRLVRGVAFFPRPE